MVIHKMWIVNLALSLSVGLACFAGDKVLRVERNNIAKAIIDSVTHGLVGLLSSMILFTDNIENMHLAIICMIFSSAIDIDHFITARSMKLSVSNKTYLKTD